MMYIKLITTILKEKMQLHINFKNKKGLLYLYVK